MKTLLFFSMFTVIFVLTILILKGDNAHTIQPNYSLNQKVMDFETGDSLSRAMNNFSDSEKSVDVDKSPQAKIAIFDKLAKK